VFFGVNFVFMFSKVFSKAVDDFLGFFSCSSSLLLGQVGAMIKKYFLGPLTD